MGGGRECFTAFIFNCQIHYLKKKKKKKTQNKMKFQIFPLHAELFVNFARFSL